MVLLNRSENVETWKQKVKWAKTRIQKKSHGHGYSSFVSIGLDQWLFSKLLYINIKANISEKEWKEVF